jgi:hypothetical protein
MTSVKLRKEMAPRKISRQGMTAKAQYVEALTSHRFGLRHEIQVIRVRDPKSRGKLMLESTVKAEPRRISFLDLPGEIRNMIYELALFGDWQDKKTRKWSFVSRSGSFVPICSDPRNTEDQREALPSDPVPRAGTILKLYILAAMSKQIHQALQTYFFANITSTKTLSSNSPTSYYRLVCRFIRQIGPNGRSGLATLIFPLESGLFNHRNSQNFQIAIQLLRECKNLRTLDLCMPVFTIIGPEDHDALQVFLLHAKTLELSGLNNLIDVLESLPRLESVSIRIESHGDSLLETKRFNANEQFQEFAFTGSRQNRLLRGINARLQKVKDGKVKMIMGLNDIDDYTAWQVQRSGR